MRYALLGAVILGVSVVAVPAAHGAPTPDAPGDPIGEVRGLLRQAYVKINLTRDLTGAGQVLDRAVAVVKKAVFDGRLRSDDPALAPLLKRLRNERLKVSVLTGKPVEILILPPPPIPATQPVVIEPPATQPVVTEPPATQPVVVEPPATQPVVVEPPATRPTPPVVPATQPVVDNPPATQPVAVEPPATLPSPPVVPATQPVVDEPPTTPPVAVEPPATLPWPPVVPATQPVVDEPPATQPIAVEPPAVVEPPAAPPSVTEVPATPPNVAAQPELPVTPTPPQPPADAVAKRPAGRPARDAVKHPYQRAKPGDWVQLQTSQGLVMREEVVRREADSLLVKQSARTADGKLLYAQDHTYTISKAIESQEGVAKKPTQSLDSKVIVLPSGKRLRCDGLSIDMGAARVELWTCDAVPLSGVVLMIVCQGDKEISRSQLVGFGWGP